MLLNSRETRFKDMNMKPEVSVRVVAYQGQISIARR